MQNQNLYFYDTNFVKYIFNPGQPIIHAKYKSYPYMEEQFNSIDHHCFDITFNDHTLYPLGIVAFWRFSFVIE